MSRHFSSRSNESKLKAAVNYSSGQAKPSKEGHRTVQTQTEVMRQLLPGVAQPGQGTGAAGQGPGTARDASSPAGPPRMPAPRGPNSEPGGQDSPGKPYRPESHPS